MVADQLVRRWGAVGLMIFEASLWLAACSSSSTAAKPASTTTSTTESAAPPRSSGSAAAGSTLPVPPLSTSTTLAPTDALTATIISYETQMGVGQSLYRIEAVTFSPLDPSWARFGIGPATTGEQFQGGYGIAHLQGSTWSVVAFGTAEVGCGPGPGTVPANVLSSLGASCP